MSETTTLHALLVEDDERLALLTAQYLQRHGVVVTRVADGDAAVAEARRHRYDVLVLDLMLPGRSGLEVCRAVRQRSDVPIIMVTALGEEADRVLGLESGADDYLPKPFSARELLARMRAHVRRARGQVGPARDVVRIGDLTLDPAGREALLGQRPLDLTAYEFDLLHALASRAGQTLGRERLMELARGNAEDAFDRSVDVHVSRLRCKLGDDPRRPTRIRTVRGVGYQYLPGRPA